MHARRLTDIAVRGLKPAKERYEISDLHAKGLCVVVHPSGTKTFVYRYWYAGKPRKLTFENVTSLAAARKLAGDAQLEVAQGENPAVAKQKRKQQAREAAAQARATAELLRQDGMAALAVRSISVPAVSCLPMEPECRVQGWSGLSWWRRRKLIPKPPISK
jgi:hypothetical protein